MRSDMRRVISDRSKTGGNGGKSDLPKGYKKRLKKTPVDEQAVFESNAPYRFYGYNAKRHNYNLNPLRRWLKKQVGRDWNDVWSELCFELNLRNSFVPHTCNYIDFIISKNCVIDENGEILNRNGYPLRDWGRESFYVDPRDNTLRLVPRLQNRKSKPQEWVQSEKENCRYYLLKDIWYEVELDPLPDVDKIHDIVLAVKWKKKEPYTGSSPYECQHFHGKNVYAARKRQLSKREIRKLKLRKKPVD